MRNEAGEIIQYFSSFIDLTEHKREQEQARKLIDELNHRVKNTLATVQAIVTQALRGSSDVKQVSQSIQSRIFALSRSHDLLTQENWEGAGLHELLDAALEPFGAAHGNPERFVITGPNVRVDPKTALALGIAFHELATNASKYGAFSNEGGSILIKWTVDTSTHEPRLILCWRERDGPPVTPPQHRGFGSQVIERGLAHELQAEVRMHYRRDGVVCEISIPLPRDGRNG